MKKTLLFFLLCLYAAAGMAQDLVINNRYQYRLAEVLYCEVAWNGNAATGIFYFSDRSTTQVNNLQSISFLTNTAIEQGAINQSLVIYPNPAIDHLCIENAQADEARIYDLTGALVMQTRVAEGNSTLHINQLRKGTYLLWLNNKTFKLEKQ